MEGTGIWVIQYLESAALDQPPDQGERYRKREQRCSDELKRKAGKHDAELYPTTTFAGAPLGAKGLLVGAASAAKESNHHPWGRISRAINIPYK